MVVFKSAMPEILIKYVTTNMQRVKIESSKDAYETLLPMYNHDTIEYEEQAVVIFLNRVNNTIGWYRISTGGMASCIIDLKKLVAVALKVGAHGMIISHNHPSGETKPSDADKLITDKLDQVCKLMDMTVVDHIIVTADRYLSFRDEALLRY